MKRININKKITLETRHKISGLLFVMPWVIGFFGLFLRPLITSLLFSISETKITINGMELQFDGFGRYLKAFTSDTYFVRYVVEELGNILYFVPAILAFSLFIAILLNQEFRGRTFARSVFFLPVIIGSGLILSLMQGDAMSNSILSGSRASALFETGNLQSILLNLGLSSDIVNFFTQIISNIFTLTWKSGIQILLFLAGLQTISISLYESAKIEGATAWESFWMITFPMISPMLILNTVYTLIDNLIDFDNQVIHYINSFASQLDYSYSSALSWIFFAVIVIVVAVIYLIINKRIVYTVD